MKRIWKSNLSRGFAAMLAVFMLFGVAGCNSKPAESGVTGDTLVKAPTDTLQSDQSASNTGGEAGAERKPEAGAKLKLWDSDFEPKAWAEERIKEFTAKYGIEVTYETVSNFEAANKIKTDGPAKVGADVFIIPSDTISSLVEGGFLYPNDVSEPSGFFDSSITACSYNGQLYGFPVTIETSALLYNKKLVQKPPETFDELIKASEAFLDKKNDKYGFMLELATSAFYNTYPFIGGFGGYVFGKDGADPGDIGLNSAGAIEGLNYFKSLKKILPLKGEEMTFDVKSNLFSNGNLLFDFNGPWAIKGYQENGVEVGVAPMPTLPNGKKPVTFCAVNCYVVSSYSDYPEAAKLLAEFLTSGESLLKRFKATNSIPPRKDVAEEPEIKNDPVSSGFLQQVQYSQTIPGVKQIAAVWVPMNKYLIQIWNDPEGDVKQLLDKAVNEIKQDPNYTK